MKDGGLQVITAMNLERAKAARKAEEALLRDLLRRSNKESNKDSNMECNKQSVRTP